MITKDRPDPRFYKNIIQGDDGNWSSDQMPLDDVTVNIGARTYQTAGLRTMVSRAVVQQAQLIINRYTTAETQRNALYILTTQTSGTPWTNAKAMMDWIGQVNTFRDSEIANNVLPLNFNQLIVYLVPTGTPPWPAPPASLVPLTFTQSRIEMREEAI
jgi:hypothetical protein